MAEKSTDKALLDAIRRGNAQELRELIHRGEPLSNRTQLLAFPLYLAAKYDQRACLDVLLETGADPNAFTADRRSPLGIAAEYGYLGAVQRLIAIGARIDAPACRGSLPLHCAARHGHAPCVRPLASPLTIDLPDYLGRSALSIAAERGHALATLALIDLGAALQAPVSTAPPGYPPLSRPAGTGQIATLDLLLEAGADPNEQHPLSGETALHTAARHNRLPVALRLLAAGADTTLLSAAGYSAGDLAQRQGYGALAEAISAAGRARGITGATPSERTEPPLDTGPVL